MDKEKVCLHDRLQDGGPCKMHDTGDDPQCSWAKCADCGGMFHMLRASEEETKDLEIRDFEPE